MRAKYGFEAAAAARDEGCGEVRDGKEVAGSGKETGTAAEEEVALDDAGGAKRPGNPGGSPLRPESLLSFSLTTGLTGMAGFEEEVEDSCAATAAAARADDDDDDETTGVCHGLARCLSVATEVAEAAAECGDANMADTTGLALEPLP